MPDALPLVSVVLPVRNAADTVDAAIESVLAQTYAGFEVIAIDDGSIDGSAARLQQAGRRDARVRVMANPGRGLTAALNHGIAAARGSLIARQDADDVSMPERFARQVNALERQPRLGAVGTAAIAVDAGGQPIDRLHVATGPSAVRAGVHRARVTPVHGSMMIRRECLATVGGYREAFAACQDFDLWLRILERYDMDNIDLPLYRWRLSPGSVYDTRRRMQLLYGGIALAFAKERARFGADSYTLLEETGGDFEAFAGRYRLRGVLEAAWGDLILRGVNDSRAARRHFAAALRHGGISARTLSLWAWTTAGLPWVGSRPLRSPAREAAPGAPAS